MIEEFLEATMKAKYFVIIVVCFSLEISDGETTSLEPDHYEAAQACGEKGQLFDAPVPGVYSRHGRRGRRSAVSDSSKLWPNGVIPYVFESAISASGQRLVRRAMNLWESKTCLKFIKRTKERDYLFVYRGGGCCSHVGRKRGKQHLSLGTGCLRYGIIVHELGHAIGFWHEQNRPDRGNYIDILYNNVERGKNINFDLVDEGEVQTFDQDYDYKSIMHYGSKFFNKNGRDTIRPKEFYRINPNTIGSRYYSYSGNILSKLDVLKANIMYKCNQSQECGGTIFGDAGSFKSPSSSEKKDRDCIWILNRKKSKKRSKFLRTLTLTFNDFDVGIRNLVTGECDGDYVEVREGKGFLSPFLTRLCGKNQPEPITTLSESLYVKFHTAVEPSRKELTLPRFSSFFKMDECSQRLVTLKGVIQTKGFPFRYEKNSNCLWKIKVKKGYHLVINFRIFNLPSSLNQSCGDYLDIHQSGYEKKLIGRYCASNNPGTVKIESNEATIQLHAFKDSVVTRNSGFRATYHAVDVNECETGQHTCDLYCVNYNGGYACACLPGYRPVYLEDQPSGSCLDIDECANKNGGCSHGCVNTEGSYFCTCPPGFWLAANKSCLDVNECEAPFKQCDQDCQNFPGSYECSCKPGFILQQDGKSCKVLPGCGADFSTPVAVIHAPTIPVSYKKEVICRWKIRVSTNLQLVFSLNLPWPESSGCRSFLVLKSTQLEGGQTEMKICSKSDIPDEIHLNSNSVLVEYHAVKPYPKPFLMRYRSIKLKSDGCGEVFDKNHGIITTPGYPFRYPETTTCVWRIKAKRRRTKISFSDFAVEYSRGCVYDFLEIEEHNVHQSAIKKVGRFCGYDPPSDIVISSNNDILIRFKSDATVRKKGFKLEFSTFG